MDNYKMKRQRLSIKDFNNTITQTEINYNLWYQDNLTRLGIDDTFDTTPKLESYKPFNSEREYIMAQNNAEMCLIQGKPVPKDLEEKLLAVKRTKEKQSLQTEFK